jgi:hypothetical protein
VEQSHDVRSPGAGEKLLEGAREALQRDDLEGALELFEAAARSAPERLDAEAYIDMVRTRLLERYRERIGDPTAVPRLALETSAVEDFHLPPDAGFLLSLIDGTTSFGELVSLSGMGPFEAFRILDRLLAAQIVGVRP